MELYIKVPKVLTPIKLRFLMVADILALIIIESD